MSPLSNYVALILTDQRTVLGTYFTYTQNTITILYSWSPFPPVDTEVSLSHVTKWKVFYRLVDVKRILAI